MRLTAITFSAILLSGCSWFGHGGSAYNSHNSYGQYGYHAGGQGVPQGCYPVGQSLQVQAISAPGCPPGMAPASYAGYGGAQTLGYSGGQDYGLAGATTTLGAAAPYGAQAGFSQGGVTTVQGAPIYVGSEAGAGFGAAAQACCGGGKALPFGLEAAIGVESYVGGDVFPGEVAKPDPAGNYTVSALTPVSYSDGFGDATTIELASTYDVNPHLTVFGQIGYSKADGQSNNVGTVTNTAGTTESLHAEFTDLEQIRLEGGLRKYISNPHNPHTRFRPYVGASAGFTRTNDVTVTQSSATIVDAATFQQTYIDGGWHPTAAGLIGAELAVSPRSAIGVETGIRWTDALDTNFPSDSQWSVPVKLRGRISF